MRVCIEGQLFMDARLAKLERLLSNSNDKFGGIERIVALGVLVSLWTNSQSELLTYASEVEINKWIQIDGIVQILESAGYLKVEGNLYKICGNEERLKEIAAWKKSRSDAGKSSAKVRLVKYGSAQPPNTNRNFSHDNNTLSNTAEQPSNTLEHTRTTPNTCSRPFDVCSSGSDFSQARKQPLTSLKEKEDRKQTPRPNTSDVFRNDSAPLSNTLEHARTPPNTLEQDRTVFVLDRSLDPIHNTNTNTEIHNTITRRCRENAMCEFETGTVAHAPGAIEESSDSNSDDLNAIPNADPPPPEEPPENVVPVAQDERNDAGRVHIPDVIETALHDAQKRKHGHASKSSTPKGDSTVSRVWGAYESAYLTRWRKAPVRNAKQMGMCKLLIERVGAEDAVHLVQWFVEECKDRFIENRRHLLGDLLSQCEGMHTRWIEGSNKLEQTQTHQQKQTEYYNQATGTMLNALRNLPKPVYTREELDEQAYQDFIRRQKQ